MRPLSRRAAIAGAIGTATIARAGLAASVQIGQRSAFAFDGTYLNAAFTHPMPNRVAAAIDAFTMSRRRDVTRMWVNENPRDAAVAAFAGLIGAIPSDIAVVPSTMSGENLVVQALGLGDRAGVVTDAFHYFGSLALYGERHRQGMPLTVVAPRDGTIRMEDIARAIRPYTRLIAVSLISSLTGHRHDLAELCGMAHARGIMVYADVIQAAGAIPIDVRATGVDFISCGGYKWLMGDFGAAFLYVAPHALPALRRPQIGWKQVNNFVEHVLPGDPLGPPGGDFTLADGAAGLFEVGTPAHAALAALGTSIAMVREIGIDAIARHRQPLLDRLDAELPRLGLARLTPAGTEGPIAVFAVDDARTLGERLKRANVKAQLAEHRIRISLSIYNDQQDIERLLVAVHGG